MSDEPSIHLYAEHLRNIRCLSIQASLETVSSHATAATLSAAGDELSLSHEGQVATIRLPVAVPGRQNAATLHIPSAATKDVSFRLQLQEKPGSDGGLLGNDDRDAENVLPWTARSLTPDSEIRCMSCRDSVLVPRAKIKTWKDLPSESWAEMMEFWHCHKPDISDDHDHAGRAKGFSADSVLALEPGIGMVNPIEFLFTREDCHNVKVAPLSDASDHLVCSHCNVPVGMVDAETGGYRLRKPYLSVSPAEGKACISHPLEQWLSSLFVTAIDTQGVRKFVVRKNGSDLAGLNVWVFTPDLRVASSSTPAQKAPLRVMKIMRREATIKSKDEQEKLNREVLLEGELDLHFNELAELEAVLEQSADLLPRRKDARSFQDWQIGLLKRFTTDDV